MSQYDLSERAQGVIRQWSNTRKFPYYTVKDILLELAQDGFPISRITFYKLEKDGVFDSGRTAGKWRRYTRLEVEVIVDIIKDNYGIDIDKKYAPQN